MGERGIGSPGDVCGAGDQCARQQVADGEEVGEPFGGSALYDPQATAGMPERGGSDRLALDLRIERLELPLRLVEISLLDECPDQHTAVEHAVHRRRGEVRERGPCVGLGTAQIAAPEREPRSVRETGGQPAAVASNTGLRDRAVEQRPHLGIPLGPQQRERGPGEERRRERRPVAGRERAGGKARADLGGLVRQDRDERRDREQLGRRCGIDSGPHAQRPPRETTEGAVTGSLIPITTAADSSFSATSEWRIELRRRTIENLDRLREPLSPVEGAREHDRRARGRLGVRRRGDGVLQVLGPAVEPGACLGRSELQQQLMLLGRRRRLVDHAPQEDGGGLGSAVPGGLARSPDEPLDDPAVGGRVGDEQMLGDALASTRAVVEQQGGGAVALRALGARELRIEPAPDDRMDESKRPPRFEDPRRHEQLGGLGALALVEPREARGVSRSLCSRTARAPASRPAALRQSPEPETDRAPDGRAPILSTCRRRPRSRTSLVRSRRHELRTRNGVPFVARKSASTKTRSGVPEPRLHELGDGRSSTAEGGSRRRKDRS